MARRRGPDLPTRLDALRSAIDLGTGRLGTAEMETAIHVVNKADARLIHGTEHTVAALAGATGSGKSSLFNALCGSQVSDTGVRRPTTGEAHASIFSEIDAAPLLDWMEVKHRHLITDYRESLSGLVLIDLPDHDSVRLENRLEMERVAELVDLLIWVTDPEKYADAALHYYLRKLAGHDDTTMVALNKIDRLSPEQTESASADLRRLLADDGLTAVAIANVSATTGQGVDQLLDALGETVSTRKAAVSRLAAETADAARVLRAQLGEAEPGRLGRKESQRLVDALADASGIPVVTAAVEAGYRRDAMSAAGWPFTRWVRRFGPHPLRRLHLGEGTTGRISLPESNSITDAGVTSALRDAAEAATRELDAPWPDLARQRVAANDAALRDELDQAVRQSDPGKWRRPIWWKVFGTLQLVAAAAVVAGLLWLAVLFGIAWFRLPDPPTLEFRGFELPPLLVFGGLLVGLVLTVIVRILASIGSRRRAQSARKRMLAGVETVAEEQVMEPLADELSVIGSLREHLDVAASH